MNLKKFFLILLIISFLGLYFAYTNGYYEKEKAKKIQMTNSQIEKFEEDIKNNEEILLKNYLETNKKYQTKTSEISLKIANKAENIVSSSIKFIFQKLGKMIE